MSHRLRVQTDRIRRDLENLSEFTATSEGITRLSMGPEEERAVEYVSECLAEAGLQVSTDGIGNLFGLRPGRDPTAPALMIASHVDSVVRGGNYDGSAGVVAGLEIVRTLNDLDVQLDIPLEIGVFRMEESAAFGKSCLGSRAFVGQLHADELDRLTNREGVTLRQVLEDRGVDPESALREAVRDPDSLSGYIELHIEQADNLASLDVPVGVVTAIAAATRFKVEFTGRARHSGATPMAEREDALCAASEAVLAVERIASQQPDAATVGTVGVLNVQPGTMTTIPGYAEIQIDLRDIDGERKDARASEIVQTIEEIADRRGVGCSITRTAQDEPVTTSERLVETLCQAADGRNIEYERMHSAAAHDAAHVAEITDASMVFIRSYGGSHNPEEWADYDDIALGTEVMLEAVLQLEHR